MLTIPCSASYLAFSMVLFIAARSRFTQEEQSLEQQQAPITNDAGDEGYSSRVTRSYVLRAIPLAHSAAQILRDFRQQYGFKVSPAWLLQLQAVTASVLLTDPELADPTATASPNDHDHDGIIHDSRTAFDEVFRCLLGTGVEVMIARGIARMMYHTALEQKIALSQSTRSLLQIMSDTAWRPSDLTLVNSLFPNFASTQGGKDGERMTELLHKWEKLEI